MEWSEGEKWDNCNSIINKYILKKKKQFEASKVVECQLAVKKSTCYRF